MRYFLYSIVILGFMVHPVFVSAKLSNDPFVEQWSYAHTGVYAAWDYSTGSKDVVVAIIDNGFDSFHPDLDDNLWVNKDEIPNNTVDDDGNGYVDDINGWNFWDNTNDPRPVVEGLLEDEKKEGVYNHGTIVAGIIGAKGSNGRDGAGLNWDVRLMNLKVLGNEGSGDLTGLAQAIRYAVDNGAHIINMSMVGSGDVQEIRDAIVYAYAHNVVVVAAAGNTMTNLNISPVYPICSDAGLSLEQIIGVSAIGESHRLASFSNTGSTCINITAPGVDIFSTVRFSPTNGLSNTYATKGWSGTSFAAPFISGAAALIKSIQPAWSPSKIFDALLSTVHHTPSTDEVTYANLFGAGLLQVDKALAYALGDSALPVSGETKKTAEDQKSETLPASVPLSITEANTLLVISPQTGAYEEDGYAMHDEMSKYRASFLGMSDIDVRVDAQGARTYVTLKTHEDNTVWVYEYDAQFRFIQYWPTTHSGEYTIVLADVMGTDQPEILLTPKFSDTEYLYIYSRDGVLLTTYSKTIAHEGCVADALSMTAQKDRIALLCVEAGTSHLEVLDGNLSVSQEFFLDSIEGGDLHVYNNKFIVAARAGRQQFLRIFDASGTEQSSFRAYPNYYTGGFDFVLMDYDDDGADDFVLAPHADGMPVRAVDFSGNFIESWFPFDTAENGQVFVLPN